MFETSGDLSDVGEVYQFPASFGQEQLWYLHEIAPGSSAYNIPFAFELAGQLDEAALERAFVALIERHDALRTGFMEANELLQQIVRTNVPFSLQTVDISSGTRVQRDLELRTLKQMCARHRFDLSQAPLLFVRLVRVDANHHVLLFCIHHIVVDHLSVLQLGNELGQLYGAFRFDGDAAGTGAGGPVPGGGERLQFPDFVVWQREQMTDQVLAEKLQHWNSLLGDRPRSLELPTDRPRPALQTFAGAEFPVRLPPDLSSAVRNLAQEEKQSPFVLMLSALNVVLNKYTGQGQLIVGCPMANRQCEELNDVVGLFMNVLPVCIDVDEASGFDQLAQHVRRQVARSMALQDTPFERIVRAGEGIHSAARNPLVQVWFTFQDAPLELALPGLVVESEALHNGGAKLDLSLWFWDDGHCIQGLIEYNTDLFDRNTVQRFMQHLTQVLLQVTDVPRMNVSEVSLLTEHERQMAQSQCARTYRADVLPTMHEAFFLRAAAQPEWPVLTTGTGTISAGRLVARADAISSQLQRQGVLPGDVVGVCLERGAALLPALLGVLRCGAAYLPLDPALPVERIAYMLEDSRARVVIAEQATREALPPTGLRIVMADMVPLLAPSDRFLPHAPGPEDLAYLMYTSGSTGRPKGVRIPHGAVGNFLSAMHERPGIGEDDVLLAVTIYAFDISVLELFLPLAFGARVLVADRVAVADGEALQRLIDAGGVTMLQATPSTWRLLRAAGWEGKAGLKALVGGESLPPELAHWLVPRVGALWNMYGPTECTVWSSCAQIDDGNCSQCPVGLPVANTSIHIVDDNLRLLPLGIPGELVIGGRGLSMGYLNRAELTKERFVRLPETGEEVYRTGDRAVWRDGQLQHLGRNDDQVKVRGFRIELGEIEAVLAKLPELESVAARTWAVGDDDHRIAAYYCSRSGDCIPDVVLREHARSFLPSYMLPQNFVHLPGIPLLPNGKIDRNALPVPIGKPESAFVPSAESQMAPHERLLLDVCRELIGSDAIALDDNFFDAGGHSLLALTMVSRIEARTGSRLPVLKIARSSLRALAAEICSPPGPLPDEDAGGGARFARWVRAAIGKKRGNADP